MWWLRYSPFFFMLCGLMGCGFQPLYAPENSKIEKRSQPLYLSIHGTNDLSYVVYKFRRTLESLLPTIPWKRDRPYHVKISLAETYGAIAYGGSATISRSQGQLQADISVLDEGGTLLAQKIDAVSSYAMDVGEEFATFKSKEATQERLINALAEDVFREIILILNNIPDSHVTSF